jgi:hypothetical protein
VKQFVHVVGVLALALELLSAWLLPTVWRLVVDPCLDVGGGDEGRLVLVEEKAEAWLASAGGEFGVDRASLSNGFARLANLGVEDVRGTLPVRPSVVPKDCDCDRFNPDPSQSPLEST